ncbi:MAG TPA: transcriptional regulator MraZ [Dehalococcoidia bacterium]|nr:transcriptional regulator MraZ [Dehalococcoidia bacterium]
MFFGEYVYKLDDKGRVPLPPKFRRDMRDTIVLTKGTEKCIRVYPLSEWKRIADELSSKALTSASQRKLNRAIFGSAFSTSFDKQGRIGLPMPLRLHAEIGETVVVVGVNQSVELWNEELWKQEKQSSEEQAEQILESLGGS